MADQNRIGVIARFDVTQFVTGLNTYIGGLRQADAATNQATRSISTMGTAVGAGFGAAIGTTAVRAVESFIGALRRLSAGALETVKTFERLEFSLGTLAAIELANFAGTEVADQIDAGSEAARGYLEVMKQLAIFSPFTTEQIAEGNRLLQVYGFLGDEALRLTELLVDFGSGAGLDSELLNRISLAVGQIRAEGRLLARDQLQLSQAGIPMLQILSEYTGQSTQELQDLQRKGLIPATTAIEALVGWLENFEGSGKRVSGTFRGLLSSLEDLRQLSERQFFQGVFEPLLPVLQQLVDLLNSPAIQAGLTILGQAIGQQIATAISFLRTQVNALVEAWFNLDPSIRNAIIIFTVLGAVLTAFVGTIALVGSSLALLINPFTILTAAVSAFVAAYATNLGGLRTITTNVANGVQGAIDSIVTGFNNLVDVVFDSSGSMADAFAALASEAVKWGTNIVNALAEGVIGAIDVVVQAVQALGQVLAFWMAPGSPPRFLPDLELWGTGAAEAYLDGWTKASFDAIGEFGNQFQGILGSLATLGRIDEVDVPRILQDVRTEFARAVDEIIDFGEITEETFNRVVQAAGPVADEAAQFTRIYARYTAEVIKQSRAQEELNALTAKYDAILAPLERRLRSIQNRRTTGDETLELRQLQRTLTNAGVSDVRKQIARARIEEIKLSQQIRNTSLERDNVVAIKEDEVRAAEAALVPLRQELELYRARFQVGEDQLGLLADEQRILDQVRKAAGSVKSAMDKIIDPLKQQLRAIQLQQEELRDLKEAAAARLVLEDENATAAQKAAAALKLQEISIRQQMRDIEAAELGVNLDAIRQIPIVLADLDKNAGKGGDVFSGLSEGFDLASKIDVAGLTAEWDAQLEESRENFRLWSEGVKTSFQEIEASLPSFLSLQQNAEGAVPAIETLKDAFAGLAAVLVAGRISAAISAIAAALGITLAPWVGLVIGAVALLGAAWARNWLGIRDITQNAVNAIIGFFQNLFGSEGLEGTRTQLTTWLTNVRQQFQTFVQNLPQTFANLPVLIGQSLANAVVAIILGTIQMANALVAWSGPAFAELVRRFGEGLASLREWVYGTFVPGVINAFNTLLTEFGPFGIKLAFAMIQAAWTGIRAFWTTLIESFPTLSEAINNLGTNLSNTWRNDIGPALAQAALDVAIGTINGLIAGISNERVQAFLGSIKNIAVLLQGQSLIDTFKAAAAAIMIGVFTAFTTNVTEGGQQLYLQFLSLPGVFLTAAPVTLRWTASAASLMGATLLKFVTTIKEWTQNLINSMTTLASDMFSADVISTFTTSALQLGKDIIGGIMAGIAERGENLKETLRSSVTGAIDALKNALSIQSPSQYTKKEVGIPIAEGIEEGTEEYDNTALFNLLKDTLIEALSSIKDQAVELAGLTSEGVVLEWNNMVKAVQALTSLFVLEQTLKWMTFYQQRLTDTQIFVLTMEQMYRTFYALLLELTQQLADEIVDTFDLMADAVIEIFETMTETVLRILDDLVRKVKERLVQLKEEIKQFLADLVKTLEEDFKDAGDELGYDFGEGIADGIKRAQPLIEQAAADVMDAAEDAAKKQSNIFSPSRKAANEIGYPWAQGIAAGIRDGKVLVEAAANSLMSAAVMSVLSRFAIGSNNQSQIPSVTNTSRVNNYNLNLSTSQSAGSVLTDFRFMEMVG